MKAQLLSIEGKKLREIELPKVFETPVDQKLIKRAVLSIESATMQPRGPSTSAGRNFTATYIGARKKPQMHRIMNTETARIPRMKNRRYLASGQAALVPQAVGGPKAHPPKPEKILKEKINKKEKQKAVQCAIAATAIGELVQKRGHRFSKNLKFPVIVENKFESLDKTKKVVETFEKLSLLEDVKRARSARKMRAGKGKKRGRKYKKAKSVLIVLNDSKKVFKSARNIEGVEVVQIKNLNAKFLAPGTFCGRLVLWSEDAIKSLGEKQ